MISSETTEQLKNTEETSSEEVLFETNLRPTSFTEYVGQTQIKTNLSTAIKAAQQRNEPVEHILLYGPPGLGKTTLANIVAKETGKNLRITSGASLQRVGDLAAILTNLAEHDVLFIDEIHRLHPTAEEILYPAIEDNILDIVIGKGPGARSVRMQLPNFTLVGATTRAGLISSPLRDRFGHVYHLEYYSDKELSEIITRSAKILNVNIEADAATEAAKRSRGTPRVANRLLRRIRDFSQLQMSDTITMRHVQESLNELGVDLLGLDRGDRLILETLVNKFNGGPVGLQTLAVATGESEDTITDVYEPYLIRQGLITRTPKGRLATQRCYIHLNMAVPNNLF